eukprot:TRINITY_DN5625_c0_g1_i2.p1 TRINITY_DN5625_c0_g1~~TRINITY_DN5625_c0_g1_i2.p1  ORF type:complete len:891 (+),score=128.42 TRINITY_DN5625_c0_g1_i2:147-2819(+)
MDTYHFALEGGINKRNARRTIKGLRNEGISAVCWPDVDSADAILDEGATIGSVLVGSDKGALHEVRLEGRQAEQAERLLELKSGGAITGVRVKNLKETQDGKQTVILLVSNKEQIMMFTGKLPYKDILTPFKSQSMLPNLHVLPQAASVTDLSIHDLPETHNTVFGWMIDNGIYWGVINTSDTDYNLQDHMSLLTEGHVLGFEAAIGEGFNDEDQPFKLVCTEYHFLLFCGRQVFIISQLSNKLAKEVPFISPSGARYMPAMLGVSYDLSPDEKIVYVYDNDVILRLDCSNEGRDVWKDYLKVNNFKSALKHCQDEKQKNQVRNAWAEDSYGKNDYVQAARTWATITSSNPSFEEIALRLMEVDASDALQEYLSRRLQSLSEENAAQRTLLVHWLLLRMLHKLSTAILQRNDDLKLSASDELKSFLEEYASDLDDRTTTKLLLDLGLQDLLFHYAYKLGNWDVVFQYLILEKKDASEALKKLRNPTVDKKYYYKYAPDLLRLQPKETVDAWIAARADIDFSQLLPALSEYASAKADKDIRQEVVRFVEFVCNQQLGGDYQDKHFFDLAIQLYVLDEDEDRLLDFVTRARKMKYFVLTTVYDVNGALKLARDNNKTKTSIQLMIYQELFEDAVETAMANGNMNLAKATANDVDNEVLKRKLWLMIAKNLVRQLQTSEPPIDSVVKLIRDSNHILSIEDILPLFPEFVTINKFKVPILDALQQYNSQIDELKSEMDEMTAVADQLREDLKKLSDRKALVAPNVASCTRCGQSLRAEPVPNFDLPPVQGLPRYFVYPTGQCYHGICATADFVELADSRRASSVRHMLGRLLSLDSNEMGQILDLQKTLVDMISSEDPRNGEIVVNLVKQTFLTDDDLRQLPSWMIQRDFAGSP